MSASLSTITVPIAIGWLRRPERLAKRSCSVCRGRLSRANKASEFVDVTEEAFKTALLDFSTGLFEVFAAVRDIGRNKCRRSLV